MGVIGLDRVISNVRELLCPTHISVKPFWHAGIIQPTDDALYLDIRQRPRAPAVVFALWRIHNNRVINGWECILSRSLVKHDLQTGGRTVGLYLWLSRQIADSIT